MPTRELIVAGYRGRASLEDYTYESSIYRQYEAVGQELADHSGYLIVGGHDAEVTADDLGEVARARGGIAGKANSPGKPGQHRARSTRAAARIGDLERAVMIFHPQYGTSAACLNLPFTDCLDYGLSTWRIGYRSLYVAHVLQWTGARLGGEEVRQVVEIAWRYRVHERHRPDREQDQPETPCLLVVNAIPVKMNADQAERRLQVLECGQPARGLPVPVILLTGETPQNRPGDFHPELASPLQELDVLPALNALVHEPQHFRVQILDTGVNPGDTGSDHVRDTFPGDVRLNLIEDTPLPAIGGQHGQQRLEITHVQDIVHNLEIADPVAILQLIQLSKHPLRRLRPVPHTSPVQPAERALMHRPPPAPPRSLHRKPRPHKITQRRRLQRLEIIIELRRRQAIQITEQTPRKTPRTPTWPGRLPVPRPEHGRGQLLWLHIAATGQRQPAQIRDNPVRLTRNHIINPRETPVRRLPHDGLAIRTAHHRDNPRIKLPDPPQQRQRRNMLLKRRRAPHHPRTRRQHPPRNLIHKQRSRRPQRPQIPHQRIAVPLRLREALPSLRLGQQHKSLAYLPEILRVLRLTARIIPERRSGESPFTRQEHHQRRFSLLIQAQSDAFRKPQVGVGCLHPEAFSRQDPAQQPERERRPRQGGIRHAHQAHIRASLRRRAGHFTGPV